MKQCWQIARAALAASLIIGVAGVGLLGACAQAPNPGETQPVMRATIAFVNMRHDPSADPPVNTQAALLATEIYLMNGDGTNPRRLTENAYGDAFPSLSPDGSSRHPIGRNSAARARVRLVAASRFRRYEEQERRRHMPRLMVFNQVTLDGYFAGENGDISWAHGNSKDPEWASFVEGNAKGEGVLVFGRVTYDLMASYWPTPLALKNDPVVAKRMNEAAKVVFSRTLDKASWNNTKLVKGSPAEEMRKMKKAPGQDMVIFGSGTIISQLAPEGLIDEYQIIVIPVVLGKGRTMFDGIRNQLSLKPTKTRTFGNGNVLLSYVPAA